MRPSTCCAANRSLLARMRFVLSPVSKSRPGAPAPGDAAKGLCLVSAIKKSLWYIFRIMQKRLAILATVAVFVSGQPNIASGQKQESGNLEQQTVVKIDSSNNGVSGQTDHAKPGANPPEWYISLERPDWWLVLAAFSTLGVICWQSIETRKSAQGAFLNAQALITAERPWLVAHFIATEKRTIPEDGFAAFQWEVKNVGRTPAIVKEWAARVVFNTDFVPLPDKPDYGNPDWLFSERILVPGGTLRFWADWYEWKDGKYQRLSQPTGSNALDLLVGFGYVKYRDTFGGTKEYISGFCDCSSIGGRLLSGDWSQWTDSPDGYAKST